VVISLATRFQKRIEEGKVPGGFSREASEALFLAAKVANAQKNLDKAWFFLEKARAQNGSTEGLRDLTRALREELERRALPFKLEGDRYAVKGEYPPAIQQYDKGLNVYPEWGLIKDNLLAVNALVEAETLYKEALDRLAAGDERGALTKLILGETKPIENQDMIGRNQEILSKLRSKRKELEDAAAARKRAKAAKQARFAAAYQRGEAAARDGKWIDASEAYKEALDLAADDERARVQELLATAHQKAEHERTFMRGKEAFQKKDFDGALREFEKVYAKDPTDVALKRMMALCYFNKKNWKKAEDLADQVLLDRRDREMFYIQGVIQDMRVQRGEAQPRSAIEWFEKIEAEDPYFEDVPDRLERLRWQKNRIPILAAALAIVFWGIMMFWTKNRPKILKNRFLGRVQKYAAKEKWQALAALEPEAKAYPLDKAQDLAVCTALAQAFYHTKAWQPAISWAQQALSKNRENPSLITLLGRIYFESRVISQDILKYLVALQEQEPENVELMRFIGEFCLDKQVINDETMPILRNLAMVMPDHDKLRRMLIRGYLRNNDTSARALALYRAELPKDPDNYEIRYYVANDAFKAGRTEEAIEHCEKILNVRLNHPQTHDLLRRAYQKLGKLDELARIYQGILENDPYNPAVQDSLKKILNPG
jgi:tetratricopeptide (TPR) repeat protein